MMLGFKAWTRLHGNTKILLRFGNVRSRAGYATIGMGNNQRKKILERLKNDSPVLIFDRKSKPGSFTWLYACAAGQLLFWMNLADIGWRVLTEKDEETGEIQPASKLKRGTVAAGTMLLGCGVSALLFFYGSRCVLKAYVTNSGTAIRLETAALFGDKVKSYPLSTMFSRGKLCVTGGKNLTYDHKNTQYILNSELERMGFVLDRRGYFRNPVDFDILFFRNIIVAP